jgi:chromosomal replication initiator protein
MTTPDELIDQAANLYSLSPQQIRQRTRIRHIVRARQVAMYLLKQRTELSLHEIGQLLGEYHHTTVMYAITNIEGLMKMHASLANEIAALLDDRVWLERSDPNVKLFLQECGL